MPVSVAPSDGRTIVTKRGDTVDSYDVIVIGGGPAGENVAGRCRRRRAAASRSSRSSSSAASARTGAACRARRCIRPGDVLAAAAPGSGRARGGHRPHRRCGRARRAVTEITATGTTRSRRSGSKDAGVELVRGRGRLAGERVVDVDVDRRRASGASHARRAVVLATGTSAVDPADRRAPRHPHLGQPRRDRGEGRAPPAAGARAAARSASRWRRRAGGSARRRSRSSNWRDRLARRTRSRSPATRCGTALEARGDHGRDRASALAAARREADDGPVVGVLDDGREIEADEILVAVGRRPNTDDLGLDTVGLEPGAAGRGRRPTARCRVPTAAGSTRSATSTAARCSPTWGSTRRASPPTSLLGKPVERGPTTVRSRASRSPTRRSPRSGSPSARRASRASTCDRVPSGTGGVAGASVSGDGIDGHQLSWSSTTHVASSSARRSPGPASRRCCTPRRSRSSARCRSTCSWHAVPSFPTVSEVWLRLLEAYGL